MAKLGEVCLLKAGKFVSANDISPEYNKGLYPCFGGNGIRGYVADYTHDGEFPLIGRQGALCGNVNLASGKFHATEHAVVVQPKTEMNVHWLYYALNAMNLGQYATGAAQPGLAVSKLETLSIEIPNISEQNKIAQTLYKVEQLVNFRKQQIAKLDELVKARFVEMFGDPVVNSKRWPVETIENHIDLLTGFPFDSSGYVSNGVNICGGLIIMPQKIDWSACKHWPQITGYEDYILRPNDIVIALDRPWISNGFKIAMVDREHLPALLIQRTARIRAVDINQHYLMQSLLLGRFDKHCNITGSLVPHISPKDIKSYSVMIPPLSLQNEFAAFVERVDQQKQTVQQSLEKLELMKKALMQEYFG